MGPVVGGSGRVASTGGPGETAWPGKGVHLGRCTGIPACRTRQTLPSLRGVARSACGAASSRQKLRPRSRFVPFCMLAVPICPVLPARRPSEQTEMLPTFPIPRPLRPGRLSSPTASSHRNKQSRFRDPGEGASSCRRPGSPARSAGRARGARRRSSAGPAPRRCTRGFRNWSLRLDLRRGESCRGCCGAWLSARIRPYRLSAWATIRAW